MSQKPERVLVELAKLASEGQRIGNYYIIDTTVKKVLERSEKPNTEEHQNYVRYKVQQFFPKSQISPGQGDNGGFIHLVVWSK